MKMRLALSGLEAIIPFSDDSTDDDSNDNNTHYNNFINEVLYEVGLELNNDEVSRISRTS